MTVETVSTNTNASQIHYRQVIVPSYVTGSYVVNDTDSHDFKIDGRGKGRLSVVLDVSTSDETQTVTVYGMHTEGADVGDEGVVSIGSFTVTDANDIGYETINDPFPFYLVRCVSAGSASGTPTATLYGNFHSF